MNVASTRRRAQLTTSEEATARVVKTLEECGIDYMLVGALSSNAHGIARSTKDADIVVAFDSMGVVEFASRLGEGFRLDRQMQIETITGSIRNVLTFLPSNFDIELFRLNQDEHHLVRFARRTRQWIAELQCEAWIQTAEDVEIQKLRWARNKDLDDVENVIGVSGNRLDWNYIHEWTTKHGTNGLLDEVRARIPNTEFLDSQE